MINIRIKAALGLMAILDFSCISSCGGAGVEKSTSVVPGDTTTHPDTTTTTPTGPIPATGFYLRNVTFDGKLYPFQVYIPAGYTPAKKWPAIVFLHSGNDVGSDGFKQLSVGLGPYINSHLADFPAIAIFPQMSAEGSGVGRTNYISTVIMSLDSTIKEFKGIDLTRIYMNGLSFGGSQGFEILYRNPNRFAAFVPVSSEICTTCITGIAGNAPLGYTTFLTAYPTLPYWQFQGALDTVNVPVADVRAFWAVYKANPNAKYTEYPGTDHNTTYPQAYATQAMWDWLWAQHR
jgi:predicted peptidase